MFIIYVILFRMLEKDIVSEKELNIVFQMTLEHVLAQRFKQNIKQIAKVTNTNKYV